MISITEILEILIVILVAIEIVELYFNMRAIRIHEKELDAHLEKLEKTAARLDSHINCVTRLDEHVMSLITALQEHNSGKR